MKFIMLLGNYFFVIVVTVFVISAISVGIAGLCLGWANLNTQFEEQSHEVHDRVATPEELEYYKQLEIERKRQEELKANPPRAVMKNDVIDTSKGLQFSQGILKFNGVDETGYGRSAGRLKGTENFHSVNGGYLDKDDFYVIACEEKICPKGGVIETSKGLAKRYDTCPTPNTIDFYADK